MPEHSCPSQSRLTVTQPVRGADRNQALAQSGTTTSEDLFLPSLEPGITLLDVEGSRGVPVLQSLVLDHLLMHDGPAFWVDANGYATTTSLSQLAPSQRLLDQIHVARGFTTYQHFGALCDLPSAVNAYIQASPATDPFATRPGRQHANANPPSEHTAQTPALIVAPALDRHYRADDTLCEAHAETLQARALARLNEYASGYDAPVLITRTTIDEFTAPLETSADQHLECEQTTFGPRFVGDEFETLVYPVDDGAFYQTTFAYWREILQARIDQVGVHPQTPPQDTDVDDDAGTGITADGATQPLTTDPLLDAWTATTGIGGR